MTNYDCFSEFAWGHVEDVFERDESQGLPRYSPYAEFIAGCAFIALNEFSGEEQQATFGFTLNDISGHNLIDQFYDANKTVINK